MPARFWSAVAGGDGADTAFGGSLMAGTKAVCALTPRPPQSKTLARVSGIPVVQKHHALCWESPFPWKSSMNPLVKKEIRLLLPSWIVAVLLAMVQAITRPYDFYVASLLFFGLTIMALTTIGRETSLNTFSLLLAQPAERMRIWQTKLSVLAGAFLIVFVVWLVAFGIAFINSNVDASDRGKFLQSFHHHLPDCHRDVHRRAVDDAVAAPARGRVLAHAAGAGDAVRVLRRVSRQSQSDNTVIAVLCVVLGIYSVGGFLFARWLFFRAQDVGWSGGVIALPEWKFLSRALGKRCFNPEPETHFRAGQKGISIAPSQLDGGGRIAGAARRRHRPANSIITLHKDSAGEILTAIFWMLWLVMPSSSAAWPWPRNAGWA